MNVMEYIREDRDIIAGDVAVVMSLPGNNK